MEVRLDETLWDMLKILASTLWAMGKPLEDVNHRGDTLSSVFLNDQFGGGLENEVEEGKRGIGITGQEATAVDPEGKQLIPRWGQWKQKEWMEQDLRMDFTELARDQD